MNENKIIFAGNRDVALLNYIYAFLGFIFTFGSFKILNNITPEPYYETLANLILIASGTICTVITTICLYFALRATQFAILSEKGIEFKSAFGNLGFIAWPDIESADIQTLTVYKIRRLHPRILGQRFIRLRQMEMDFYSISCANYHIFPRLQVNPKKGSFIRTIPARNETFEEILYSHRPDLNPRVINIEEEF